MPVISLPNSPARSAAEQNFQKNIIAKAIVIASTNG